MSLVFKIDERSKAAKLFAEYVKTLPFVKVVEEEYYDLEFVKMVKTSAASKNRTVIGTNDIWGSLGLQ